MVLLWLRFFSSLRYLSSGFRRQTFMTQHGCVLQTTRDTKFGKKLLSNPNAKSWKTVEPCPNRLNSKRETEEKENHLHGKPAPFCSERRFLTRSGSTRNTITAPGPKALGP